MITGDNVFQSPDAQTPCAIYTALMADSISIRLPARLRLELERFSERQNRPVDELAREAVQRYIAAETFRSLRARTVPLAEARGLLTEEDVFCSIDPA